MKNQSVISLLLSLLFLIAGCNATPQIAEEIEIPEEIEEEQEEEEKEEDQDKEEDNLDLDYEVILDAGLESTSFPEWKKEGTVNNSSVTNSGQNAAKVTNVGDQLFQTIRVHKDKEYELSVYVKGGLKLFIDFKNGTRDSIEVIKNDYTKVRLLFTSSTEEYIIIGASFYSETGRFDDFDIKEFTKEEEEEPTDGEKPTDIIPSLVDWKVTLPVDKDGNDNTYINHVDDRYNSPLEIHDEELIDYEYRPYFFAKDNEVIFRGHCAGATTRGSKYPRCELRQRVGGGNNYWSMHNYQYLKTVLRVTHLPVVKPEVCMTQIHGPEDEPLRVQYSTSSRGLHIYYNEDFTEVTNIDYELGQLLEIEVIVDDGDITCNIKNLENQQTFSKIWTSIDQTGYFKVGCYTQSSKFLSQFKSNYDQDEPEGAYGEVAVQSIELIETY